MKITVAGEALIDLIIDAAGNVSAYPGGAGFNVARAVAGLGGDCQFLGRTGDDAFGRRLRRALEDSGVRVALPEPAREPTTLALAELDAGGTAAYHFYLEGTAGGALRAEDLGPDVLAGTAALAIGGLGLVMEPIGSTLRTLLGAAPSAATVLLDPNGRPQAIAPGVRFADVLEPFLARADVVKVSTDDLLLLAPGADPRDTARGLLDRHQVAVLVTDGPGAVTVLTAGGADQVPVPKVSVLDTVGAGDAFVAGFLTWWTRGGHGRQDLSEHRLLLDAARAAVRVAAAACTVAGAGLPVGFRWEV
ncbi:MAG TPA: carbohydrate kinase [Solirubrobacteraceae bacterium]